MESIRFSAEQVQELLQNPETVYARHVALVGIPEAYRELEHQLLLLESDVEEEEGLDEARDRLCEAAISAALNAGSHESLRQLWEVGVHGSKSYFIKDSRTQTLPRKEFREMNKRLLRGEENAMDKWLAAAQANRDGACTVQVFSKGEMILEVKYPKREVVLPPSDPNEGKIIVP